VNDTFFFEAKQRSILVKSEQSRSLQDWHNVTAMKLDPERLRKVLNRESEDRARIIRQIWEEGHERAAASVREARKVDKKKAHPKLR
jgi:hypothetical protein